MEVPPTYKRRFAISMLRWYVVVSKPLQWFVDQVRLYQFPILRGPTRSFSELVAYLGYVHLLKAAVNPFSSDFGYVVTQITKYSEAVNEAIRLADAKLSSTERQLQGLERSAAGQHRSSTIIYRAEMDRRDRERLAQKQIERQRKLLESCV
jgi:hypothetical protein